MNQWNAHTGKILAGLGGGAFFGSVAFSPNGDTIASGSLDGIIRLWKTATIKRRKALHGHSDVVTSVAFSPGGSTLASGSWDNTIRLWNADTGKHLQTFHGHSDRVTSVAFSPNGDIIASGGWDNTIRLWGADKGEQLGTLKGHTGWVWSVAFSPDGRTIASGSDDGTVLLWEVASSIQLAVESLERLTTTLGNIKRTALLQNFPNPFNPETWIPYQLADDAHVTLRIYDQSGRIVRTLDVGPQKSGVYQDVANAVYWDGRNQDGERVTSGTYFYQFRAGDYTALRQMVILK